MKKITGFLVVAASLCVLVSSANQPKQDSSSSKLSATSSNSSAIYELKINPVNAEATRHQSALQSIEDIYNPKISASKALIQSYKDNGAKDTSADIVTQQKLCDEQQKKYLNDSQQYGEDSSQTRFAWKEYNKNLEILQKLKDTMSDYDKMVQDQNKLTSLQSEEATKITEENNEHASKLSTIQQTYPTFA